MKRHTLIAALAVLAVIAVIMANPKVARDQELEPDPPPAESAHVEKLEPLPEIEPPKKEKIVPKKEIVIEAVERSERGAKIDAYFAAKGMPLEGRGDLFVAKADEYGVEWTLLAAISVIESTGGKHMCTNNPFGWGSCRIKFATMEEAIDTVSRNLGGHNPRTRGAYAGGSADDLWSYNGTVDPSYPGRVEAVMRAIAATKVEPL